MDNGSSKLLSRSYVPGVANATASVIPPTVILDDKEDDISIAIISIPIDAVERDDAID